MADHGCPSPDICSPSSPSHHTDLADDEDIDGGRPAPDDWVRQVGEDAVASLAHRHRVSLTPSLLALLNSFASHAVRHRRVRRDHRTRHQKIHDELHSIYSVVHSEIQKHIRSDSRLPHVPYNVRRHSETHLPIVHFSHPNVPRLVIQVHRTYATNHRGLVCGLARGPFSKAPFPPPIARISASLIDFCRRQRSLLSVRTLVAEWLRLINTLSAQDLQPPDPPPSCVPVCTPIRGRWKPRPKPHPQSTVHPFNSSPVETPTILESQPDHLLATPPPDPGIEAQNHTPHPTPNQTLIPHPKPITSPCATPEPPTYATPPSPPQPEHVQQPRPPPRPIERGRWKPKKVIVKTHLQFKSPSTPRPLPDIFSDSAPYLVHPVVQPTTHQSSSSISD